MQKPPMSRVWIDFTNQCAVQFWSSHDFNPANLHDVAHHASGSEVSTG